MDYGIRWDSWSGKPSLSLSKHDTSSFHHVRRRGEERREEEGHQGRVWYPSTHTPRVTILSWGVHGDLSQCLRSRVFCAPIILPLSLPVLQRSCIGIPVPTTVDSAMLYHSNLDPGAAIDKALVARLFALLGNYDVLNVIDKVDDL